MAISLLDAQVDIANFIIIAVCRCNRTEEGRLLTALTGSGNQNDGLAAIQTSSINDDAFIFVRGHNVVSSKRDRCRDGELACVLRKRDRMGAFDIYIVALSDLAPAYTIHARLSSVWEGQRKHLLRAGTGAIVTCERTLFNDDRVRSARPTEGSHPRS